MYGGRHLNVLRQVVDEIVAGLMLSAMRGKLQRHEEKRKRNNKPQQEA